jgi:eukaryotic-like serine/threonine-protein kinase
MTEWQRLRELFDAACGLEPEARERLLEQRCAGEATLRKDVDELLAADDATPGHARSGAAGRRFGAWQAIELVGRGGMAEVYLAQRVDGQHRQRAALKLMPAALLTPEYMERFRRERQILAGLEHNHIARLLDGGMTPEGEPYLVMEFVDGQRLDDYCETRGLSIEQRLRLFLTLCLAVESAHRSLVLHRDIKPSNVLVTADGMLKLVDFGAARVIDGGCLETVGPLTPAFASPEQLRGQPVTTLSDVYGLGMTMYKLLAGTLPLHGEGKSAFEAARAAMDRDADPPSLSATQKPAAWRRRLQGDLDNIVCKAIDRQPERRYPSAERLASDIARYLEGQPVEAHPASLAYRTGKFIRRHAAAVAAAAILSAGLAGAAAYSAREGSRALREAKRAEAANRFLATVFQTPFADRAAHHDMTVRELLELAEERVKPVLGSDPATATDIDLMLGSGFQSLQSREQAHTLFQRAYERARLAGDTARQAAALSSLATSAYMKSDATEAWKLALESLALWKANRRTFTHWQAVQVLASAGQILRFLEPSNPIHREYLEEAVRLGRLYPKEVDTLLLSVSLEELAESYLNAPGNAEPNNRLAYPLIRESMALDRADPSHGSHLLTTLQSWGRINRFLGNYAEDESAQREAYIMTSRLFGDDAMETASQRAIWAYSLISIGRTEEAYRESQAALAGARRWTPVSGSFQLWTNTAIAAAASCLTQRYRDCETLAREALHTLGPHPEATDLRLFEARSYLGLALAGQARVAEALPLLTETVNFYRLRNRKGALRAALENAYAKLSPTR